jgi:hypothetical protein
MGGLGSGWIVGTVFLLVLVARVAAAGILAVHMLVVALVRRW